MSLNLEKKVLESHGTVFPKEIYSRLWDEYVVLIDRLLNPASLESSFELNIFTHGPGHYLGNPATSVVPD